VNAIQTKRRRCMPLSLALALAGLLGALLVALQSPSGARAAASAPAVVVSPLTGTPDADPGTQISFLGAPASRLRDIVVRGSKTGPHAGRLAYYSTHTGGSFLPDHPFAIGEHVTVTAEVVGYGSPKRIGTRFTVADPYTLPPPPHDKHFAATATNVLHFHSRPDLDPAAVTVTAPAADPSLGDIFVSPDAGPGDAGPEILAPNGQLVWFKPLPWGTKAFDLNLQSYAGSPVLTWWQGEVVEGHGQGVDEIESTHYTPIATVHAGNGLHADLHDFRITPQGTAWVTAFAPQHMDLRPYGGREDGLIDDGVVQEIDIKTGLVMFDWHAMGHVAIADTYMRAPKELGKVLDYFHVNSIDPLPNDELLISSRNTWATYLISERTGSIVWRLGGKKSTFKLGTGLSFAWQHDAELQTDGTLTLFNNDASPPEAKQSSALDIALDVTADTATLVHQYTYPGAGLLSESQGDVQILPNGDDFVGWGQAGEVCEFSPQGALTFDMHFAQPANSYRAFRYPWSAQPLNQPALVAGPSAGGRNELYASWNGATDVASWRVLAGASPHSLATVGTYPASGFETAIAAPTQGRYLRVQALSSSGGLLRTSAVVKS
jgi:Arylsulfotransferase (ASST)